MSDTRHRMGGVAASERDCRGCRREDPRGSGDGRRAAGPARAV